jgi:hypothetical protein
MSESEPPPPQDNSRNRLWTRVMLVGFFVLVLAYVIPTFFPGLFPSLTGHR